MKLHLEAVYVQQVQVNYDSHQYAHTNNIQRIHMCDTAEQCMVWGNNSSCLLPVTDSHFLQAYQCPIFRKAILFVQVSKWVPHNAFHEQMLVLFLTDARHATCEILQWHRMQSRPGQLPG